MPHESQSRRASTRKESFVCGQELNPVIIKQHAGQFDLDAVTVLHYTGRELSTISCLEECVNAIEINFSDNAITRISGMETLVKLRKLVLTNNKIRMVESIENLENLEHLLLQGNQISTLEELNLSLLQKLPKLVSLYLKNVDGSHPNPVCKEAGYRETILRLLPQLRNLDGERLRSKSNTFYQEASKEPAQLESDNGAVGHSQNRTVNATPFAPPGFWDLEGIRTFQSTEEVDLKKELVSCRDVNEYAKEIVQMYKPSFTF